MKVTIVRKIETEEIEVPDGKYYYKERAVSSTNFGVYREGEEPLSVVVGEEITYTLQRVRNINSPQNFFVRLDERGIFNQLINVTGESFEREVERRVSDASENFYIYDLPEIKKQERLLAHAEIMRLPFLKKLQLLFA